MANPKIIGIVTGIAIAIATLIFFYNSKLLSFLLGMAVIVAAIPFIVSIIIETGREKEKEEMFLAFSMDLVEAVKAGAPISKSILQVANKDYGVLTRHVKKLANQIALGIPLRQAIKTFASDVKNKVISRSVELIIEAELSGGDIGKVMDSVVRSVREIEDLKKERASRVFGMIVQGYIIFFIFIVIMLFVEIKFIPMITMALAQQTTKEFVGGGFSKEIIENSFFILLLVQAFFAGLVIGKLSEGSIKYGIKHSVILLCITYIIVTATRALAG